MSTFLLAALDAYMVHPELKLGCMQYLYFAQSNLPKTKDEVFIAF